MKKMKSKKKPTATLKSLSNQLSLLREDLNRLTLAVLEPEFDRFISSTELPTLRYAVTLQPEEDGGFSVIVPALRGCVSQGDTVEEAIRNIAEAIELSVECLAEEGLPVPPSYREDPTNGESALVITSGDVKVTLIPTNVDVSSYQGSGNPHFCGHANECPTSVCSCPPDCYCEGRTCPGAIPVSTEDLMEATPPDGYQLPIDVVAEVSAAEVRAKRQQDYDNWARKFSNNENIEAIRKDWPQSKDVKL